MPMRDIAKTTVTIYNFVPSLTTFKRTVIHDCIWKQESRAVRSKQGTALPANTLIQLPYSYKYVSVRENREPSGEEWTIRLGAELKGSYIINGICAFMPPARYSKGRDDFVRDVALPFEKRFNPIRPVEINEQFFGSRGLWHVEVIC